MAAAPYIIALDPATTTGICHGYLGSKPRLLTQQFRFADDKDEDLYGAAVYFLSSFLKDRKPDLIAIEAPIRASWGKTNDQTTSITRGLYAVFTGIARCKGIPVLKADIGTWRKYFLGRGNLKGAEAKRQCVRLCAQLGWDAEDHNAAESAGIWCWAGSTLDPRHANRVEPLFAHASHPAVRPAGDDGGGAGAGIAVAARRSGLRVSAGTGSPVRCGRAGA